MDEFGIGDALSKMYSAIRSTLFLDLFGGQFACI